MKSIFYLTLVFSLILGSCQKDFLEKPPQNSISETIFWKTENDVFLAVNGMYVELPSEEVMYNDGASDIGYAQFPWESVATAVSSGIVSSSTEKIPWSFIGIRKANYFLSKVDKVIMDEALKNRFKAEVRFIRALLYIDLVNNFGDVPLITKELTIAESNVPRDSKSKILKFIIDELTDVAKILPISYEGGKLNEKGRITKGAALALMARFQIQQSDFVAAAKTSKEVMLMGYELFKVNKELSIDLEDDYSILVDFKDDEDERKFRLGLRSYEGLFHQANEGNKEVILDRQYIRESQPNFINTLLLDGELGGYSSISPTQNLVNAYGYYQTGGRVVIPSNETRVNNYKNNMTAFVDEFRNRDPRFYATILFETAPWNALTEDGGYEYIWSEEGNDRSKTGYGFRKFVDPNAFREEIESHSNFIILRYAEILLTFAEAQNEISGPSQEIYAALDKIRMRAGMPIVDQSKYNTKETLRQFIRKERLVEMALEGLRYTDIRRWGIASEVMKTIYNWNNNIAQLRIWDDKLMLLPIPQQEIDNAHGILIQNENYY